MAISMNMKEQNTDEQNKMRLDVLQARSTINTTQNWLNKGAKVCTAWTTSYDKIDFRKVRLDMGRPKRLQLSSHTAYH